MGDFLAWMIAHASRPVFRVMIAVVCFTPDTRNQKSSYRCPSSGPSYTVRLVGKMVLKT